MRTPEEMKSAIVHLANGGRYYVATELQYAGAMDPHKVDFGCNEDGEPFKSSRSLHMMPAEARALAAVLLKIADEAEALDAGKPQSQTCHHCHRGDALEQCTFTDGTNGVTCTRCYPGT